MGSRARLGVVLAEPPLGQRVRTPGSQQHAVTVLRGRAPAAQAPRPRSHGAQTVCTGLSGLNYMLVIKRALNGSMVRARAYLPTSTIWTQSPAIGPLLRPNSRATT